MKPTEKRRAKPPMRFQNFLKQKYNSDLQILDLQNEHKQWADILRLDQWQQLKYLYLRYCRITDSNMQAILSLRWTSLQYLDLYNNKITDKGVIMLVACQWPQLIHIDLSCNQIGNEGMNALMKKKIGNLQKILAMRNIFNGSALIQIKESPYAHISFLNLTLNKIGSKGCKLLTKGNLSMLEMILISVCQIGSEGAKHLSKGRWPLLTQLNTISNKVGIDGFQFIVEGDWRRLNKFFYCEEFYKVAICQMSFLIIRWAEKAKVGPLFGGGNFMKNNKLIQQQLQEMKQSFK